VKKALCTLLAATVLILGYGPGAWSAGASSQLIGTWTLNLEKSKFNPGPPPKSDTRQYELSAQGVTVTVNVVAANGSVLSEHATYKYDGKDYPLIGNPNVDALSLRRINASTTEITQKLAGKVVGTETRVISADGKVMTISSNGTNAKGLPSDRVAVYDKQ
jgi:hypothetical protein